MVKLHGFKRPFIENNVNVYLNVKMEIKTKLLAINSLTCFVHV